MPSISIKGTTVFGAQRNIKQLIKTSSAFWNFKGETFNPLVGGVAPFTLFGNPSFEEGPKAGTSAMRLEPNVYVKIPSNIWNVVTNPTSHTVAFWFKPNQLASTGQECVMFGSCFGPFGVFFTVSNVASENFGDRFNEDITYWLNVDSDYESKQVTVPFITTTDTWYHVAGVYDLPTQTAKLYVNGAEVGTEVNVVVNNVQHPDWDGFAFNGSPVGPGDEEGIEYGLDYSFSSVGLWSRALSDGEIRKLYEFSV